MKEEVLLMRMRALVGTLAAAAVLTAGVVAPAEASPRTDYLKAVKKAQHSLVKVSNASLIGYGNASCKALRAGLTFDELANEMASNSNWTSDESGAVLAGAVYFLCPAYKK
jgi:hypothetical protein